MSIAQTLAHETKNWLAPVRSLIGTVRSASADSESVKQDLEFASTGLDILRGVSMGVQAWAPDGNKNAVPYPSAATIDATFRFLLSYHMDMRRRRLTAHTGDWHLEWRRSRYSPGGPSGSGAVLGAETLPGPKYASV